MHVQCVRLIRVKCGTQTKTEESTQESGEHTAAAESLDPPPGRLT